MEWIWVILIVLFAVGWFALSRASFVPSGEATRLLANGAVVIDVRTAGEFAMEHLPHALNIPLSEVREQIARQIPDKSRVILVHCHAGGRSEIAKRRLKAMGYTNVHNLGSFGRAQHIVSSAG